MKIILIPAAVVVFCIFVLRVMEANHATRLEEERLRENRYQYSIKKFIISDGLAGCLFHSPDPGGYALFIWQSDFYTQHDACLNVPVAVLSKQTNPWPDRLLQEINDLQATHPGVVLKNSNSHDEKHQVVMWIHDDPDSRQRFIHHENTTISNDTGNVYFIDKSNGFRVLPRHVRANDVDDLSEYIHGLVAEFGLAVGG